MGSPEVNYNLLCLPHIQGEIGISTPHGQWVLLVSVVGLITVADDDLCCMLSLCDKFLQPIPEEVAQAKLVTPDG